MIPPCRATDSIVHHFTTGEGAPAYYGSLTLGDDFLYGMTGNGGDAQAGSIFRVGTDGNGYAAIHNFTNDWLNTDGAFPLGSLTAHGCVLYGMTRAGGIVPPSGQRDNEGTVFKINANGGGFQVLHGFAGSQLAGSHDGALPYGSVTVSGSTIYGMTRFGGTSARGTLFCLNTDGGGFSLLHSFAGTTNDGAFPEGSLTLVGGKLFGVTNGGGENDNGTVFSINTDGNEFTLLHSFGPPGSGDGAAPVGENGLTLAGTTLYGVTFYGGAYENGAIFRINPDGTGYQIVHSLDFGDGAGPCGSLTLSGSQLYGTTNGYGSSPVGTLGSAFSMSLDGHAFTVIHAFGDSPSDGAIATGNPVLSADGGTFYGMTEYGGAHLNGTIFSAPASGSLTNANLFDLVSSAGAASSDFRTRTTRYSLFVSDATPSMSVTPTSADAGASVTVNGVPVAPGSPSSPMSLRTGTNVINIIVTARDGVTTNIYTLTVIRLTPLENWRLNYFGTTANAGHAANAADYDSNGIPNLVEYAFGLDPTAAASRQIPQAGFSGSNFGFAFSEPAGISGITYGAEWTQLLNPPIWAPIADTGSGAAHTFSVAAGSLPLLFVRLKVTVPLSPVEKLGKAIFFDDALSSPAGISCASCHSPTTGFTGPNSEINLAAGPVPGVLPGRSGHRKPQAISYAAFSPSGPYFDGGQGLWTGGSFWDGHAPTQAEQARMPFVGPNEMANIPEGPYPPHPGGYSPLVVQKLSQSPYADLFRQVFGAGVFQSSTEDAVYAMAAQAIAAYEASEEVNPFSSKFDASENAVPPSNGYQLTASEENGRQLFFGKAQCFACHSSAPLDSVSSVTSGREVFTMFCYASIGTPKNPDNPFYGEQDSTSNPYGYNPLGAAFIDYGLGANPNPSPGGTIFMSSAPGDVADFRGLFKAPSLRNADKRPSPDFVKSYMHNGVFKSLEEVVHFYNKRNIAVNESGGEIAFDLRVGPPPGYTPLFPPPEVIENVQNVAGLTPSQTRQGEADVANNGQIGHLQLSPEEEADLVNFLKTLTDGFLGSDPEQTP